MVYSKESGCLDKNIVSNIPQSSGVYIFKDENNKILYVGKAKNLRRRVRSYFSNRAKHIPRIAVLVSNIRNLDYIVTEDEIEAFILENNLIKRYHPKYNIRLKDDKRYPYIMVSLSKKVEVKLVYRIKSFKRKNAFFYGPFPTGFGAKKMANLIVRNIDGDIADALKARARQHGISAEAEHRLILKQVLMQYI